MQETEKNEMELDLRELFALLLDKWWIILTITIASMAAVFIYTIAFVSPMYKTSAEIYIMPSSNGQISSADISIATSLTFDYNHLLTGRNVLDEVNNSLGLNMSYGALKSSISIVNPANTRFLIITVSNTDPELAQKIADKICEVAAVKITALLGVEQVNKTEDAYLPAAPSSPSKIQNTIIGGVVGFALTCAVIILIFVINDKLKNDEDIKRQLGLTTLGIIPCQQKKEA